MCCYRHSTATDGQTEKRGKKFYHGPVWVGRALQNHLVSYQNPSGSRIEARWDVVGVSEVVSAAVTLLGTLLPQVLPGGL